MNLARICLAGAVGCIAVAALLSITPPARALPTDPADSVVTSPEVSPDHKVTFRLRAPGAQAVRVIGDFALNGVPMTKAADGTWAYTTDALKPSIYGYSFNVDGVRFVDPGNLYVSSGGSHLKSYVEVPGDKDHPEFWETRDVPHGMLHEVRYKSPELGDRRVIVYTPPGYDAAAAKTYPTIYLLHSATDNETYWFQVGRANDTMDNLLADNKCTPAIVVSCFGWPSMNPGPEQAADGTMYYVEPIDKEMVSHVVPLIDKDFRTSKASKDRAILGFSGQGGCQALTIGLNNADTFGNIASFSAGWRNNQDMELNFKAAFADIEKTKKAFKVIEIKVGTNEAGNTAPSQNMDRYLTGKGIPHTFVQVPGGIHAWVSWREYFKDYMTEIFKN